MDPKGFSYRALGFAAGIGAAERSLSLARMQVEALRRDLYDRSVFRPTEAFIARVLGDCFGLPVPAVQGDRLPLRKGEIPAVPRLRCALRAWRDPDPADVLPHCIAACDAHTHLSSPGPSHRREFVGAWSRTPVAVLLVLRLRASLELENPPVQPPCWIRRSAHCAGRNFRCGPIRFCTRSPIA